MPAATGTTEKPRNVKDVCRLPEMYRYDSMGAHGNSSSIFGMDPMGLWKGIPEVLLVNTLTGLACIVVFTFIRKRFWDYGRIAYRLFTPGDPMLESNYDVFAHMCPPPAVSEPSPPSPTAFKEITNIEDDDDGLLTWLHLWAELTDEEILIKCGSSAIQYLQFQNVIMVYLSVVTQFCLMFLLPINMSGKNLEPLNITAFSTTTIDNLSPTTPKLWIHFFIATGFFVYGLYSLRFYARSVNVPWHWRHYRHGIPSVPPKTTVIISQLPNTLKGNETLIRKYLEEAYPDYPVIKVVFAYDVKKLSNLNFELKEAESALKACERLKSNELITIHHCRLLNFSRCRCVKKVPARDFYGKEVERLKKAHEEAIKEAKTKPLPYCFVTFQRISQMKSVVHDFGRYCHMFTSICGGLTNIPPTSMDDELRPRQWNVAMAPKSTDIVWENLSAKHARGIRIGLNVAVTILLVFLSTPSVLLNHYVKYLEKQKGLHYDDPNKSAPAEMSFIEIKFYREVIPTVLHVALTALLPYAIEGCEEYSRHITRSGKEMRVMLKTFIYLLFMILILPSFGMSSGVLLLIALLPQESSGNDPKEPNRWECLFLPENSAFFVNFILTSALFGIPIQVIRPGHIVYYMYTICQSRSRFEMDYVRDTSIFRFPYGSQYASMGAIFATAMAYCVACPLIAPCAFFYFCLKSQVDRYNIYFAFEAHYVPQQMHRRVANFLIGSCLFAQAALIAFTVLRRGGFILRMENSAEVAQVILMLLTFAVSLAVFFCQLSTGWFFQSTEISPFQHLFGDSESEVSSSAAGVLPEGGSPSSSYAAEHQRPTIVQ